MALEIRTTQALVGVNRTPAKLSIEQPKAEVDGSISLPKIKVEGTLAKIKINQTQCFNESGRKSVEAFSADYVNFAKQKMQESIGRIAEQGNQLTDIHLGGNPIADQGASNAYDQFEHEFGMVTMPRSRPQIDVIEGTLDIKVEEGEITGKVRAKQPILNHDKGNIEFYLKQKNSISIKYLGENVDISV